MAGPQWLIKPFPGPMSDTFAEHAARAPNYAFKGQDGAWSTPADWEIVASHDGIVDLRYDRDYGNHIVIDGMAKDGSWETLYGHLAKFYVADGEYVQAGQPIGLMGATGNARGIHLHHELRINGRQVDPVPYYVSYPPQKPRSIPMAVTMAAKVKSGAPFVQFEPGCPFYWASPVEWEALLAAQPGLTLIDQSKYTEQESPLIRPYGTSKDWAKLAPSVHGASGGSNGVPDPIAWGTAAGKAQGAAFSAEVAARLSS